MAKTTTTRKEAAPAAPVETNLEPLLREIQEVQTIANLNLETVPYAVRGGHSLRKGEAQETLPKLLYQLHRELFPKRVLAVIAGPGSDLQATDRLGDAVTNCGMVWVDLLCLYHNIAVELQPAMGTSPTFGVSQYTAAIAMLRQEAERLGVNFRTPPDYREVRCPDVESLTQAVRDIARATVGDELLVAFARQEVVDTVLDTIATPPVPRYLALVTGMIEDERPALAAIFLRSAVHDILEGVEWSKDDLFNLFTPSSTP